MKTFSRKFRENKIFSGIWEKNNKIVRAGLSRLHCICSQDIFWEKFWNKNDEKSINFSQSWSKVFQHGCQKSIQHVLRSILRWSFLTNFLLFLELYRKIFSTVVKTAFLVPVRKLWGEKSFEKRSQLKELCLRLWPKNVQSLVKTALYVSKGIFCHLRLKNLYSLFRILSEKLWNSTNFFLKNSQNWIVLVQRKVYPGESLLKVRENTEHFLDFEPNLFVTVVRTAIHASRKKNFGKK